MDADAGPAAAADPTVAQAPFDVPQGSSLVSTTGPGRGGGNVDLMVEVAIVFREATSISGTGSSLSRAAAATESIFTSK